MTAANIGGLQYLVLGPVTNDPRRVELLARRVMPDFVS